MDRIIQKWPKENRKNHKHFFIYEFGFYLLKKFFNLYKERGSSLICDLLVYNTAHQVLDVEGVEVKKEKKPKAKKPKKPKIQKDYAIITTEFKDDSPEKMDMDNQPGFFEESD